MCIIIVDQSLQRNVDLTTLKATAGFWSFGESFLEVLEHSLELSGAFWSFLEISGVTGTDPILI